MSEVTQVGSELEELGLKSRPVWLPSRKIFRNSMRSDIAWMWPHKFKL